MLLLEGAFALGALPVADVHLEDVVVLAEEAGEVGDEAPGGLGGVVEPVEELLGRWVELLLVARDVPQRGVEEGEELVHGHHDLLPLARPVDAESGEEDAAGVAEPVRLTAERLSLALQLGEEASVTPTSPIAPPPPNPATFCHHPRPAGRPPSCT